MRALHRRPGKKEEFFENNPDKHLKFADAYVDAEYVYSQLLGGLPDIEMPKQEVKLSETDNEKKESWFKRHK